MIYHLVPELEWNAQSLDSAFAPAAFAKEGFIHTSYSHQLEGVYRRYYSGREDLLVLQIDPAKLKPRLVEEPSTGGEMFPHIYGKLNKDAIVKVGRFLSARS